MTKEYTPEEGEKAILDEIKANRERAQRRADERSRGIVNQTHQNYGGKVDPDTFKERR